jgi:hypothetical protein
MAKDPWERYAYFVTAEGIEVSLERVKAQGLKVKEVHGMPCITLRPAKRTALVAGPEVWSGLCRRQGSWYRQSAWAGRHLLVVPMRLPGMTGVSIRESEFQAPSLPGEKELIELAGSDAYRRLRPKEWEEVSPEDIKQIMGFRERLAIHLSGVALTESFEHLFLHHCANHANFLAPRFFVEEDGHSAPYSIACTARVCSACVEIFDVLGSEHRVKYVVPCPGAVTFAGLPADRYLRIERLSP